MNIEVLYEDDALVVINKPAGLVVHSDGRTKEATLVDWIIHAYPEMQGVGEVMYRDGVAVARPGIVHRLDRDTSGVMVLARNQETFLHIKKQFKTHTIEKEYRAFVHRTLKNDEGVIDRAIGRSSSDFRKWSAQRGARGEMREAITEYKVLKKGKDVTYLSVIPKTGRTHQIRVHFQAINYPVVCDKLYAQKKECLLGFERHALHAHKITFDLPSGERKTFEAPLPEDFVHALDILN